MLIRIDHHGRRKGHSVLIPGMATVVKIERKKCALTIKVFIRLIHLFNKNAIIYKKLNESQI